MINYKTLSKEELKEMEAITWWHSIPVGYDDKKNLLYTPGKTGPYDHREFGIPDDLTGKTVLDIGAWDGSFTWACEKLGGEVTSIDTNTAAGGNWGGPGGYEFCKRVLGAKAKLIYPLSIYDLPREMYSQFDLVLNFGVLYHLHHPMIALEKTFLATRPGGMAIFETAYDSRNSTWGASHWSLWPNHEGDPTNYFYPTIEGLKNALKMYGFVDCRIHVLRTRRNFLHKTGRLVMTARRPA
jgi:tRNA (mo5U34)-methyltransferase